VINEENHPRLRAAYASYILDEYAYHAVAYLLLTVKLMSFDLHTHPRIDNRNLVGLVLPIFLYRNRDNESKLHITIDIRAHLLFATTQIMQSFGLLTDEALQCGPDGRRAGPDEYDPRTRPAQQRRQQPAADTSAKPATAQEKPYNVQSDQPTNYQWWQWQSVLSNLLLYNEC